MPLSNHGHYSWIAGLTHHVLLVTHWVAMVAQLLLMPLRLLPRRCHWWLPPSASALPQLQCQLLLKALQQ